MRRYLFRGRCTGSYHWIEGDLRQYPSGQTSIKNDAFQHMMTVDPETVGQYTGLTDTNGKRIFEGDIIQLGRGGFSNRGVVIYSENNTRYGIIDVKNECNFSFLHEPFVRDYRIKVVGNIHDNPELLEVQTNG